MPLVAGAAGDCHSLIAAVEGGCGAERAQTPLLNTDGGRGDRVLPHGTGELSRQLSLLTFTLPSQLIQPLCLWFSFYLRLWTGFYGCWGCGSARVA